MHTKNKLSILWTHCGGNGTICPVTTTFNTSIFAVKKNIIMISNIVHIGLLSPTSIHLYPRKFKMGHMSHIGGPIPWPSSYQMSIDILLTQQII